MTPQNGPKMDAKWTQNAYQHVEHSFWDPKVSKKDLHSLCTDCPPPLQHGKKGASSFCDFFGPTEI